MMNVVNTTQRMRRKERHKFSRTMAVILGLIVTLEVMVAGGMIFNIGMAPLSASPCTVQGNCNYIT